MQKVELKIDNLEGYFVNESFKTLRTNLQFCGSEYKVIDITSCDASEGKTTTALLLAKSLSDIKKKVIYVDCDLRKSVVATRFSDAKNVKGLSEYLANLAQREEIICNTQYEYLDIVLSGPCCPNPVELMMTDKFEQFVNSLKAEYDYVIMDTPPLGLVIDSAVVAKNCDGAVLVISSGRIRYKQARITKTQLEKSGCKILGAVLNHAERRSEKYYKKYYQKRYGKSYYSHYYNEEGKY